MQGKGQQLLMLVLRWQAGEDLPVFMEQPHPFGTYACFDSACMCENQVGLTAATGSKMYVDSGYCNSTSVLSLYHAGRAQSGPGMTIALCSFPAIK